MLLLKFLETTKISELGYHYQNIIDTIMIN